MAPRYLAKPKLQLTCKATVFTPIASSAPKGEVPRVELKSANCCSFQGSGQESQSIQGSEKSPPPSKGIGRGRWVKEAEQIGDRSTQIRGYVQAKIITICLQAVSIKSTVCFVVTPKLSELVSRSLQSGRSYKVKKGKLKSRKYRRRCLLEANQQS